MAISSRPDRWRDDLESYVTEHGRPYLKAENPMYPNLVPARELRIQGVMVSLVRKQMPAVRRNAANR